MIRAVFAGYTANGGQIRFLWLFTPYKKSLCPKNQNSSMIRAKVSLDGGKTADSAEVNGNQYFSLKDRKKYTIYKVT